MLKRIIFLGVLLIGGCSSNPNRDADIKPREKGNEAAMANLNLAIEYMRRGEYELALNKMERARQADPEYYATYNAFGLLYQRLGDPREAERNFKKALSLSDTDSATLNNYGRLLCQQGRLQRAEETFLKAAQNPLYATPDVPLSNIARCLYLNGQTPAAEKYFLQALDINPQGTIALLDLSQINFDRQNYLAARTYIQRYARIARHTADSLLLGIQIAQQLGDENAVSSYALQLRNNFPDSQAAQTLESMGIR